MGRSLEGRKGKVVEETGGWLLYFVGVRASERALTLSCPPVAGERAGSC